jgi:hypothetical protein
VRASPRSAERSVEVAERRARLRPNVEQLDADLLTRMQRQSGCGELLCLPDGVLVQRPLGGALVGTGGRSGVAGLAMVAGDLGPVHALGLEGGGEQPVQASALTGLEHRLDGLAHEVVRGRPAELAETQQADARKLGQPRERRARVGGGRRSQSEGRDLPPQERDEGEQDQAGAPEPMNATSDRSSLALPAERDRQRRGVGAACRAADGELAQASTTAKRRAVG